MSEIGSLDVPFHGEIAEPASRLNAPLGLTVAISREAGARGGSIARRVGKRLGWQVYTQELLEFLCANDAARQSILTDVPHDATAWVGQQLNRLRTEHLIDPISELGEMPRLILTLAARGDVILVGRGAGYYLPRATSLHIRIVAPIDDRIAHMADWLRMTPEEAAKQVDLRDERRAEFLNKHFGRRGTDVHEFDQILNSGLLFEETCTDAIVAAINGKQDQFSADSRIGD
jgi:Cytidylate kinase-like family